LKEVTFILLFVLISISLEANYCIQVLTSNASEKNSVLTEVKSGNYNQFENVRVDSRGNYLVFRIGDYTQYNDAKDDIAAVKQIRKEAYVRKCDFEREQAVYILNANQAQQVSQNVQNVQITPEESYKQEVPKQKTVVKKYVKKEELTYSYEKQSESLWGDCKKCFIPVYEEEGDSTVYTQEKPQTVVKRSPPIKEEIEVRVQEPEPTKESFWAEDITTPKKRKTEASHSKNKFNIDEQFLP